MKPEDRLKDVTCSHKLNSEISNICLKNVNQVILQSVFPFWQQNLP